MPEGLLRTCGIPVLSAIPAQLFADCTATVTKLILKGNGLSFLPPEIAALGALECLDVSENAIEELPPLPPSLTELNISENRIGALPAHLGTLTALETLVAFKNAINSVPAEIANCTALTEVNLFNNKVGGQAGRRAPAPRRASDHGTGAGVRTWVWRGVRRVSPPSFAPAVARAASIGRGALRRVT
jgi:hypothetical protein